MAVTGLTNVIVYIDDILLHLKNHFKHTEQLKKTLSQTQECWIKGQFGKIQVWSNKCQLFEKKDNL